MQERATTRVTWGRARRGRVRATPESQRAAICDRLRKNIDAALPQATSKIWHAIPVWLVGENVAVGYTVRKSGVMLMDSLFSLRDKRLRLEVAICDLKAAQELRARRPSRN